ncbi:pentatricopeptide repeat-containing protein At5g14080 [Malania oleifera]|uniref:pentatricopeptide repeat-containing protein At5g14080 n=1 Tax=Malania oleifera TaxID=397392 RepID=UPI0025AEC552|nr:pentatricopeptide repeat-containing protein At5g14080 [Malania oleifera]
MKASASEFASRIGRALISASAPSAPTRTWTPSLEQTLHRLGCRDSLTPPLAARVIDPFLLHHPSLALGFFNWASQQPGFAHTSLTYQSVLKSLSLSRQFNALDTLLKRTKSQKLVLEASVYRSVIASLIVGKRTHNAFLVFSEVSSLGKDIGTGTCSSLLAALAAGGYLDCAQKVFDEITVRGVGLSTLGFGVYVWNFCKTAELSKTLSLVDEVRKWECGINGSIVAILIVHGLCQASRLPEAFWALDELRTRGFKPDFMAYRVVAEAFRLTGSISDVEKTLKKKRKMGVAPRANDYREFIFELISEKRVCEARELGEVIVSGNFPIEDDVLNALVGSVSAIDPSFAMIFFNFMIGKEKLPTLLTVINLSRNLCKHDKTDELLDVFRILSSKDYFADLESYNVMVSFLCKSGRVKEAYGVLQEMKKKGFGPDVSSYNSLMEACCREDLLRPAKRLWDEMFASGCSGDLKTYNILIRKLSEVGQVEEAWQLFHHMLEKGIVPDGTTYTSLLEGLCQERKFEAAIEVYNKSIEQDVMLARTILSTFILHVCREGHFLDASKLLRGLPCDIGDSDSHVILLKCLADAREIPIAIEHIKWVGNTSPSMLEAISTELLASLSSSPRPELIQQLLQAMQEKCLVFNNDTWKYLCHRSLTGC